MIDAVALTRGERWEWGCCQGSLGGGIELFLINKNM